MSLPQTVLASASPRRRRLVSWLGIPIATTAVDTPEDLSAPLAPEPLAASLAAEKAMAAREQTGSHALILAFDTIVVADGEVLGKPVDADDARRMLRALAGRTHEVVTGVAIFGPGVEAPETFSVTTPVAMRTLSDVEIDAWIERGEALGCAGAYNIEHHLASVADDQCFQNVAGLPLCHVYAELAGGSTEDVPDGLTAPVNACDRTLGRRCLLGPRVCGTGTGGGPGADDARGA